MLSPEEITGRVKSAIEEQKQGAKTESFHKGLFLGLKVAFAQMIGSALKTVKKNTYSVKVENQVELPKVQQIEGVVTLKDIRTIVLGLNEVVKEVRKVSEATAKSELALSKNLKPERVDFSAVEKAVNAIKIPETVIPDFPTVMQISNLAELKKPLADLASKLKIPAPIVNVPPNPKTITVGNLEAIETFLANIQSGLETQPTEEPTGYSFKRDENGNLVSFTEIYPSGKVTSTGWALGAVTITDDRDTS